MIAASVVLSASTVAAVVSAVAAAAMVALRAPSTEGAAEVFITAARNPFTWIGLFAALFAIGRLRSKKQQAPAD